MLTENVCILWVWQIISVLHWELCRQCWLRSPCLEKNTWVWRTGTQFPERHNKECLKWWACPPPSQCRYMSLANVAKRSSRQPHYAPFILICLHNIYRGHTTLQFIHSNLPAWRLYNNLPAPFPAFLNKKIPCFYHGFVAQEHQIHSLQLSSRASALQY